jgi:hypothetical protein
MIGVAYGQEAAASLRRLFGGRHDTIIRYRDSGLDVSFVRVFVSVSWASQGS